jgi:hypothetical protein
VIRFGLIDIEDQSDGMADLIDSQLWDHPELDIPPGEEFSDLLKDLFIDCGRLTAYPVVIQSALGCRSYKSKPTFRICA